MQGQSPVPPVQGGFLVIRPSLESFKEFQAIIRKVTYHFFSILLEKISYLIYLSELIFPFIASLKFYSILFSILLGICKYTP